MVESHFLAEDFAATGIPVAFLQGPELEEFASEHQEGRFAIIVLDAGAVRLLEHAGAVRSSKLQDMRGSVILELMKQLPLPVETPLSQAQLEVEARERLVREFGVLTSSEVSHLGGGSDRNPYARAQRWRREGRVFALDLRGKQKYPAFQFDLTRGEPRPAIGEVLKRTQSILDGWQTAMWFIAPNSWLDERRPVDLLDSEPRAIVDAAEHLGKESGY